MKNSQAINMANPDDNPGVIDLSTDTAYCRLEKAHLSFQVFASVDGERRLKLFFRTESDSGERSAVLRGTPHFREAVRYLSGRFDSILAQWTPDFGTNLEAFNGAVMNGMSKEAAALTATWTGRRAGEAGYSEVVILAASPEDGPPFVDVEIDFRRPNIADQSATVANVSQVKASIDPPIKLLPRETELLATWYDLLSAPLGSFRSSCRR
jgi:hypothetical protein